jgi:hypothetical protein
VLYAFAAKKALANLGHKGTKAQSLTKKDLFKLHIISYQAFIFIEISSKPC